MFPELHDFISISIQMIILFSVSLFYHFLPHRQPSRPRSSSGQYQRAMWVSQETKCNSTKKKKHIQIPSKSSTARVLYFVFVVVAVLNVLLCTSCIDCVVYYSHVCFCWCSCSLTLILWIVAQRSLICLPNVFTFTHQLAAITSLMHTNMRC